MERDDRPAIAGFYWPGDLDAGSEVRLPDAVARHAHVRRIRAGTVVRITNGQGTVGRAQVLSATAKEFIVAITDATPVSRPSTLHVLVPVADRDRMLLAAEKAVELQVSHWHPVRFARSRSVSPRGEGARFRDKLVVRMISALEQSGGAWMPAVAEERDLADVLELDASCRLLLDASGAPIRATAPHEPTAIAVGPEGGLEPGEIDAMVRAGWVLTSLAKSILRFETAVIAGAAVVRALQQTGRA